jgi:hypothetical protein
MEFNDLRKNLCEPRAGRCVLRPNDLAPISANSPWQDRRKKKLKLLRNPVTDMHLTMIIVFTSAEIGDVRELTSSRITRSKGFQSYERATRRRMRNSK